MPSSCKMKCFRLNRKAFTQPTFFFNDHHFKSLNSTLGRSSLIFSSIIILSQLSGGREVSLDVKSELLFIFFSLKMDWILVKLFLSILFFVNFKNQSLYLQLTVFIVYRLKERLHGTVLCLKNQFFRLANWSNNPLAEFLTILSH